ncbi:helix-turn-helix transcriptional regulator [Flavobacterium sp. JLP]|uniref:helix-turn-helix domain-containing protein n=1 Tax=Flavobacterium sp. JLP TaxID=2783793 RepID=UPI00188C3521|nr:AraC family transcriptional regulator [Flavobacterium sp. JLP]MBF4507361.1 helix-turn-helix transcriptional regulator [Flavobacterium sp. JLP]
MNFYQQELNRIKSICYSNEGQIRTVIRTRKFIEHNFDKELDLNLLSHTQFTSKFHLLRLFKKYYGVTPKQYLIDKRIEKSKQYLKNGMTVTETCFAVGFESPSSFSTLFKSKIGVAPIEFQKKQFSQSNLKLDLQTCTSQF